MNQLEQSRIEDFIKSLNHDELVFMNHLIIERLKLLSQRASTEAMMQFNLGEKVEFDGPDGKLYLGLITKINKKTIKVTLLSGAAWNISPQLLRLRRA